MRNRAEQIENELLVIRCQQGDSEAYSKLVAKWQRRLFNYAYKVTGSKSASWDIVQDTWYAVIKGLRKLDDASVFGFWVFRILSNKCNDWLRKQQRRARLSDELRGRANNSQAPRADSAADSLEETIEKLSPDRRILLALRYKEEFDIAQIAQILNIPEGTVKSRLHRTLEKLRQLMERRQNG
ncbi:MAG TPA: RNA polymerase sigma factor [Planctomycetes bacterium]|nr:RNA polymerase sigma factor [Planctomycetota bacterium]HIJ70461.1 RNA polymerase sigma factor [Planctomycetota bacterium]